MLYAIIALTILPILVIVMLIDVIITKDEPKKQEHRSKWEDYDILTLKCFIGQGKALIRELKNMNIPDDYGGAYGIIRENNKKEIKEILKECKEIQDYLDSKDPT